VLLNFDTIFDFLFAVNNLNIHSNENVNKQLERNSCKLPFCSTDFCSSSNTDIIDISFTFMKNLLKY
jgi:hypothetical protein